VRFARRRVDAGEPDAGTVAAVFDLVLRNGLVVDGTGAAGRRADVGVRGGRITAVGDCDGTAARSVDVDGLVVAPGFIDPHTHYDAQLFWDPAATPSSNHGVTTVLAGNCGFTLAPVDPDDADYLRRMMAKVEGMPLAALETGLPWSWRSFAEYLDALEGNIGVNAGFLVGHSAIRRNVMGPDATGNPATPAQVERMVTLLHEALAAGGLGFSSSKSLNHSDGDHRPVPSYFSEREELLALSGAVADHPGTWLEYITTGCNDRFSEEEVELMADMSAAARRPMNWNVLVASLDAPERTAHQLAAADVAAARGGRIVALTMPALGGSRLSFGYHCVLYLLPGWADVMNLPFDQKVAALSDPAVRARLDEGARTAPGGMRNLANWERMLIGDTYAAANAGCTGRMLGDIAAERGQAPFDALCDITLADDFRTALWPQVRESAEGVRARVDLLRDPRTIVGGSDAGAHLDRMCGGRYTGLVLASLVREHGVLSLEEAVMHLTDAPARLFGLTGRGRVAEGYAADLVVFDPDTVGSDPIIEVFDLPGGCERLYGRATGVHRVFVNGVEVVVDGEPTGATPGTLLRSGRDTATVLP
jgi:N-acyl-D-aspartate/D-glutamate deacylase